MTNINSVMPAHATRSSRTTSGLDFEPRTMHTRNTWQRKLCMAAVATACVMLLATGCTLNRAALNAPPVAFQQQPTLLQVVEQVNGNSSRVQQLHSEDVRLSIEGLPISLTANLDYDRPSRFRLSGETFRGRELDLGCNDQEYWFWGRDNKPPTVFHGRQDQFFQSAAQQFLPMPPYWLAEALGVVYLDPNHEHTGPFASETPGLLQIQSYIPTPGGNLLRKLEIDQRRGLVMQQRIYDSNNQLLAAAQAKDFHYDALQSVSLPHRIAVQLPPAGLSFDFEVDRYTINQGATDPNLWTKPEIPNHRYRDLANPADMQGISLLGGGPTRSPVERDVYRNPTAPDYPRDTRSAWLRMPPISKWLR